MRKKKKKSQKNKWKSRQEKWQKKLKVRQVNPQKVMMIKTKNLHHRRRKL